MHEDKNKELLGEKETPDERATFWAFTSYILFVIPLASNYKDNHFVKYHTGQGLVFFIVLLLFGFLAILSGALFWKFIIFSLIFVLWFFGITYVLLGKEKPLPIIGWIGESFL